MCHSSGRHCSLRRALLISVPENTFAAWIGSFRFLIPMFSLIPGWCGLDALQAMDWAQRRRVPVVVMSESQRDDLKRSRLREWLKARYLQNCQAALVGGSPHREYLEYLGMDPARIWCGYDAVDNAFFSIHADAAKADASALRHQYDLPERFFLASARFIPKKNLLALIRAYQLYRRKAESKRSGSSGWELVLLGDGILRQSLEAEVATFGFAGNVKMPGFQQYSDLPAYYGLADAFVMPSNRTMGACCQ